MAGENGLLAGWGWRSVLLDEHFVFFVMGSCSGRRLPGIFSDCER